MCCLSENKNAKHELSFLVLPLARFIQRSGGALSGTKNPAAKLNAVGK